MAFLFMNKSYNAHMSIDNTISDIHTNYNMERDSNIELLRIISMFMIVFNHLSGHGVMHRLSETPYVIWAQGSFFNKIFSSFLGSGGEVGVAIFFIITGYFYCSKNHGRIMKVCLQTLFYSLLTVIAFVISKIFGANYPSISTISLIKNFAQNIFNPVSGGGYWFVTVYVAVILLIPLVNPFLRKLSKRGFVLFLFFAWFFWYFLAAEWSVFFQLQKGLFFYAFGAFIQLHLKKDEIGKWRYVLLFWIAWILGTALQYEIALLGSAVDLSGKQKVMAEIFSLLETGVVVPLCAVSLFRLFESLHIRRSKIINIIASTTFGVYLLHDSVVGRNLLWYEIFKVDTVLYRSALFPLMAVCIVAIIFGVSSLIDYLRGKLIEPIMIDKCYLCVEKIMDLFF